MEGLTSVCIDTDVLIDYLRGPSETTKQFMKMLHEKEMKACTTTINSFEIWFGVYLAPKPEVLIKKTEEFMDQLEIIDFSYETSIEAGRIQATLRKEGQVVEVRDVPVASIAKVSEIPLVTRNLKHYQRIQGLAIAAPEQVTLN